MAHEQVHNVHQMIPNAMLMSLATIAALAILWFALRPTVEGHRH